jgi:hypothetical protein
VVGLLPTGRSFGGFDRPRPFGPERARSIGMIAVPGKSRSGYEYRIRNFVSGAAVPAGDGPSCGGSRLSRRWSPDADRRETLLRIPACRRDPETTQGPRATSTRTRSGAKTVLKNAGKVVKTRDAAAPLALHRTRCLRTVMSRRASGRNAAGQCRPTGGRRWRLPTSHRAPANRKFAAQPPRKRGRVPRGRAAPMEVPCRRPSPPIVPS